MKRAIQSIGLRLKRRLAVNLGLRGAHISHLDGLTGDQISVIRLAFDSDFYLRSYDDIKAAGIDPFEHFMIHGWIEGRNPNAEFVTAEYIKRAEGLRPTVNPFVEWAIRRNQKSYLSHLLSDRQITSLRSLFDKDYYCKTYNDINLSGVDPLDHFLLYGWREGRNPSAAFDTNFYIRQYMNDSELDICPLVHYIMNYGKKDIITNEIEFIKHRISTIDSIDDISRQIGEQYSVFGRGLVKDIVSVMFSPDFYRSLKGLSGDISDLECFFRYLVYDFGRGVRPGPLFDGTFYSCLAIQRGLPEPEDPDNSYLHWLQFGVPNDIPPGRWFNEAHYRQVNKDLANFPGSMFLHFLQHGLNEGRQFHPAVHLADARHQLRSSTNSRDFVELLSTQPDALTEIDNNLSFWRSDTMREVYHRASALEPQIEQVREDEGSLVPPWHDPSYRHYRLIQNELMRRGAMASTDSVVLVPFCKMGGRTS